MKPVTMWSKVMGMFLIAFSKTTTRGEPEAITPHFETQPIQEIDWNEGTSAPTALLEGDDFKSYPPEMNQTITARPGEVAEKLDLQNDESVTTEIPSLDSQATSSTESLNVDLTSLPEEGLEESKENILDLFSIEDENFFIPFDPEERELQYKTKGKPKVAEMNGIITGRHKVALDNAMPDDKAKPKQDLSPESLYTNHNQTNNSDNDGILEIDLNDEELGDFKVFGDTSEKVANTSEGMNRSQENLKEFPAVQESEILNFNASTDDDYEELQLDSQLPTVISEVKSGSAAFLSNYSVTEENHELNHLNENQEQLAYLIPVLDDSSESGHNSFDNITQIPFTIPFMYYNMSTLLPEISETLLDQDTDTNTTTSKADLLAQSSALAIDWGDIPSQFAVNPYGTPYGTTEYTILYTTPLRDQAPTQSGTPKEQGTLDEQKNHFQDLDKMPGKPPSRKVYQNSRNFRDFGDDSKSFHQLIHDPGSVEFSDKVFQPVTTSEKDNITVEMSDNDSRSVEVSSSDHGLVKLFRNVSDSSKTLSSSSQIFRSSRYHNQNSLSSKNTRPFQRLLRYSKGNGRPFRYSNQDNKPLVLRPTGFESKKIVESSPPSRVSSISGSDSSSSTGTYDLSKSLRFFNTDSGEYSDNDHTSPIKLPSNESFEDASDYSKSSEFQNNTFSNIEQEPISSEDLDQDNSRRYLDYFEYEGQTDENGNASNKSRDLQVEIFVEAEDTDDNNPESALRHLRAIPLHLRIPQIPSFFTFKYLVDDLKGNYFGHEESRDIHSAKGKYFVLLPDGRLQTVNYLANQTGYFPRIVYTNGKGHPPGPHTHIRNVFAPGPTFSPTPHPFVLSTGFHPLSPHVAHPIQPQPRVPFITTPLPLLETHLTNHFPVADDESLYIPNYPAKDLLPTNREPPLIGIDPPVFRIVDFPSPAVSPLPPGSPRLPILPDVTNLPHPIHIPLTHQPLHLPFSGKPPLRKYHLTTTLSPNPASSLTTEAHHKPPKSSSHHQSALPHQNHFLPTSSPLELTTDHKHHSIPTSLPTTSLPHKFHPKPLPQHPPLPISNHHSTTTLPSFPPTSTTLRPVVNSALPIPPTKLPATTPYPTTLSIRGLLEPKFQHDQGSPLIKITPKSIPRPFSHLNSEITISTLHPTPLTEIPHSKSVSFVHFSASPKLLPKLPPSGLRPIPVSPHSTPVPITFLPKSTPANSIKPGLLHHLAQQRVTTVKPPSHDLPKNYHPTTLIRSHGPLNPTLKTIPRPTTNHPSLPTSTTIAGLKRNLKKPGGFQSLRSGPTVVFPNRLGHPPLDFHPLLFQSQFQTSSPEGGAQLGQPFGGPPFSAYLNAEQMILKNPRFHFFNPFDNKPQQFVPNLIYNTERYPHAGMLPHPLLQVRRSFMAPFITIPLPSMRGESRGRFRGETPSDSRTQLEIANNNHDTQKAVLEQLEDYDEAAKDYL